MYHHLSEAKQTEAKLAENVDSIRSSTTFSLEIEAINEENQNLSEKLIKAKLNIEQMEKLVTASTAQLDELQAEYLKIKKEFNQQCHEAAMQKDYQAKEIATLQAELDLSQSLLDGRCTRLERISNRNAALQADITRNRYKILSLRFKSSTEEEDEVTEQQSSNSSSSQAASESSEAAVVSSADAENSPTTTTEELESTNESYSS